jgi:CHAT domain-containing protein
MRLVGTALVVVAFLCSLVSAKPRPPDKQLPTRQQATPAQQAEINKLDKELSDAQIKQAYFAAVKIARKLYELQKKATGDDSLEARSRRQSLAGLLNTTGDYAGAEKIYTEILRSVEKEKGPESREALYALMPLAGVYWGQSRYEDLEPLVQRQLALTKKLDGEKSTMYATQLSTYGALLNVRNEYTSAQRVYEQALVIQESMAASKNDISLVGPIQVLASIYWQTNQQPKAIALYDRAIAISQTAPNTMPIMRISTMWSVSAMYFYGGRKDLAQPLIKKTIAFTEAEIAKLEQANPDDYQVPALYGQLGYMYRQSGDLVNAEKAFMKTIAIAEKKKQYSGYDMMLADLRREQGKHKEALALLERAKTELGKISPLSSTAYNTTIADVLRDMGDYKRAEQLLDEHRTFVIKNYGKKHPMYGAAQLATVNVYAGAGKVKEAEQILDEALDVSERELALVLRSGTDTDHAVYFGRNAYVLDTALNFGLNYAPGSGSATRLALTTLLRRKGRILDAAAAALATIRSKLSPDDKKILDELNSARAQLAKLVNAGPSATGGGEDYAKEIAALEDKVLRLELQVSKKSAAYRTVTQPIELTTIQKAMPADARLVEIVNFQPWDPNTTYAARLTGKLKPRHYAAYIVGPKGDPAVVDLGEAAPIDKAVEEFRKAVSDPDNDRATDLGRALYDLTMAKVVPKLGGSTNILIAPDGALNVVPFSALVDDKKDFLIKKYTFTYLTSGRDLLRLGVKTKAQGGGVVFADPKFDSTGPAPAGAGTRGRRSADLRSLKWNPLPGTGQEADALIQTMKGLKVFRGDDATEGELKKIRAPKILHLATHGFFLPDEPPPPAAEQMPGQGPRAGGNAPTESFENPLLRSGLALAGANKLSSGNDDGVLTALEASGLDLWGTKLVVLSACETGVGKVSNGEGVYGLRRSLVIAGAESLVMTLWQVDDFATKDLMAGYYKKLAAGKPRSAALREIQLELAAKEKYAHPFYWASFLPAGALTPIKD